MIGRRFGRLTVVSSAGRDGCCALLWRCICACGNTKVVAGYNLGRGDTKSCGCLRAKRHDYGAAEYLAWTSMLNRCGNPKQRSYPDYGGRGIKVCRRWVKSYANFLADMGRRPSVGLSLDRIDNSKGYSPGNCRWATRKEQANNSRKNRLITYHSVTRTITEWSGLTGIKRLTIAARLDHYGWTIGQALGFEPPTKAPNRLITYESVTRTLNKWATVTGINRTTISQRLDAYRWPVAQALGFEPRA